MAGADLPSFHDTFVIILQELELLKQLHLSQKNTSDNLYTAKNEISKSEQHSDAEVPVVGAKIPSSPASQSNPSFRKRKRKQENDKIFRVDIAKAEEEDVLEQLKAEECRYFVKYFSELLPNFTPDDAVLKETANLSQNLEVCKRLISRAGRFIREKNVELEAENARVEELEEILNRDKKFREELRNGVFELQDTVKAIVAASEEGNKTNCMYCSLVFRELGEQKNQDMVESKPPKTDYFTLSESIAISDEKVLVESAAPAENALEETPLNSIGMSSIIFPLKPLKNDTYGSSDEMELCIRRREILPKSNGSPKVNEKSEDDMLFMNCKSCSIFPEFQQHGNVTGVYLQREAKEPARSYGKEIDIHKIQINMGKGNECKSVGDANEKENVEGNECKSVGDANEKENGAVDGGESPAKMSSVIVTEGNECKSFGDRNEKEIGAVDSGESQAKISTARVIEEEPRGPIEDLERTGLYNDLANKLDIKEGYGFIELKCGCTSLKQIDTLGTLRVYESGGFEIYCQCKRGCNNGKPMTPAAFEMHGGCGHNRKWKHSIWILMRDEKVQMSKAKILKPYYQKYKGINSMRASPIGNIRQTRRCNESIPDKICLENSSLRRTRKEDCNMKHSVLGTAEWRSSRTLYDRIEGNFSNRGRVSCFAKEDDLQKKNGCYNLRSR